MGQPASAEVDPCIADALCSARYISAGNNLMKKKDYKGAITQYNKSNANRKSASAYTHIAKAKILMGDKDGAYQALRDLDMVSFRAYGNYNGTGLSMSSLMTANSLNIPIKKKAK